MAIQALTPINPAARLRRSPVVLAVLLCCNAHAQNATNTQTVTVTGRSLPMAPAIGGFGDEPLSRTPLSGTSAGAPQLQDAGARQLAEVTRFDASISDAYNAEGYWSFLSVRGFVLDNAYNYRRDGLPINAETAINLANKQRVDVLKGTSGIQAGTSAPGGLVDLIVKRPEGTVRSVSIEARQGGTWSTAIDLGQRFGEAEAFGLRVNAAYEHLDPLARDAQGHRQLFSAAGDWRISPDTLLEAEFETSLQTQPSVPGFSLLGDRVPDPHAIDPRINLNNQPWVLPVVLRGNTSSLRWQQRLTDGWQFTAHGMRQRLTSDDRTAFPFGCSTEGNFDRYCSDGSFDVYDFRSEHEHRDTDALDLRLAGRAAWGGLAHSVTAGLLFTRFSSRLQGGAFNPVGIGNIDGTALTPEDSTLTASNTDRDERSTELYLRDAITFSPAWRLWAGLRHTRLHRASVQTDGSEREDYRQSATLPWLALSHQWTERTMVYASWGQGLESEVAPNLPIYSNSGRALPALKSRQTELGWKYADDQLEASLAAFDIRRPQTADAGACSNVDASCTRVIDGQAQHRGIETAAAWRHGPWTLRGSAMLLKARIEGASVTEANGLQPVNVPRNSLRVDTAYAIAALPGLTVDGSLVREGRRMVLPDNSASIPAWTRFDAAARYAQRLADGTKLTWRAGIDNLTGERAWRESPYQFDHAYLFPLAARTWRLSLQADL